MAAPASVTVSPDGHYVYSLNSGRLSIFKRDSNSPVCENVTVNVVHGTVPTLTLPCRDEDGDPLSYQVINPPTLGTLGALDNGTSSIVYAAPQGQNGTTTFTLKASYTSFATFEAIGSITVNVVGAPSLVPAGIDNDKDGFFAGQDCNDANAAIRPGATEIKGNRIDENCDGTAEPFQTLAVGVSHGWDFKKSSVILTLKSLLITQQSPAGMKVKIFCKGKKCPFKSKKLEAGEGEEGCAERPEVVHVQAAEVPRRADARGVGECAELQHEGRSPAAEEGQGARGPGAVRRARAVQAAEEVR